MIKIPNDGQFSQPNNSDLFGNISATRNMNFDEEGYVKLSARSVMVRSAKDDNNFGLPIAFGRDGTEFHVVTEDSPFDISLTETNFSVTRDVNTNAPSLSFDSGGKWFQNRWHATTNTKMWYTTGAAWTDTNISLTTGKVHAIEVFRSRNTVCVSNGNVVKQYTTGYAASVDLTVPADYEVVGLSYSNAKMGVITMMSDTAAGQNQEAYFFTWDGVSTGVSQGFGMGSDTIMGIVAYKSSWAILTRTGELKYFNGGGFETLADFPFYFINTTWGDSQNREAVGEIMTVEGDVIYINVGNDYDIFGRKGEFYVPNNPAGVWCYDPKVGLYHRYSPSISPANQITVPDSGVNITTNILTASAGTIYPTGNPIKLIHDVTSVIGGLAIGRIYYIIRHTATTFSLAETYEDALDGNKIDLTSTGSSFNFFMALKVLDFGTTKGNRTGGMGFMETRKDLSDHLLFGGELDDFEATDDYESLCMTSPRFENRGYFITAKIPSINVEDNIQKVYLKYRPLDAEDAIVVKYKNKDVLNIPTSTPQYLISTMCTWSDSNTLTTTADLSAIKDYLDEDAENECEVEIISGAGSGTLVQISSISYNAGTYTINLADDVVGAAATYRCNILIDNWKVLQTVDGAESITFEDTEGFAEFPLNEASKATKFKVELRGYETTVEDFQIINDTQLASV